LRSFPAVPFTLASLLFNLFAIIKSTREHRWKPVVGALTSPRWYVSPARRGAVGMFDSAVCEHHPDAAAATTCERCGVFMCERCTYFGVERKCVKCRIKRSPAEYPELIANAVRRSEMMRCRRCGYLGRRHDDVKPLRWGYVLALPFALRLGVVPGILILLYFVGRGGCLCPACETTVELIPAPPSSVPSPEAELAWAQASTQSRRVQRTNALKVLAAVVVSAAVLVKLVS